MKDEIRNTNCVKPYFLDLASLTISQILGNNLYDGFYLLLNLLGFSSLALWKSKHRSASIPIPK
jgi:hypothetical protein